jgi:hypothetical protein
MKCQIRTWEVLDSVRRILLNHGVKMNQIPLTNTFRKIAKSTASEQDEYIAVLVASMPTKQFASEIATPIAELKSIFEAYNLGVTIFSPLLVSKSMNLEVSNLYQRSAHVSIILGFDLFKTATSKLWRNQMRDLSTTRAREVLIDCWIKEQGTSLRFHAEKLSSLARSIPNLSDLTVNLRFEQGFKCACAWQRHEQTFFDIDYAWLLQDKIIGHLLRSYSDTERSSLEKLRLFFIGTKIPDEWSVTADKDVVAYGEEQTWSIRLRDREGVQVDGEVAAFCFRQEDAG